MDDFAIRITGLGKEYVLRSGPKKKVVTLRDTIAEGVHSMMTRQKKTPQKEMFWALKDINMTIPKGARIGIIGKNGAGKSTLLKLISRITYPTEGMIEIDGKVSSLLEVGTGFHPELSGRENIYLNGAFLGMSKTEIEDKFDDIIAFSEIGQFINTPVKRYSSGMYVRLAFAVSAHLDPEIFIVDEVLAVGDVKFQSKCLSKMSDVASGGRTVIYVSHNLGSVRQLCNYVMVLDRGRIIFFGGTEEGIAHYLDVVEKPKTSYTFDHLPRSNRLTGGARMSKLNILSGVKGVFLAGDDIVFKVSFTAKRDLVRAMFRMTLKTLEDQVVGTAFSAHTGEITAGRETEVTFRLHDYRIAPGKYKMDLVLSEADEQGAYRDMDAVNPAFVFDVIQNTRETVFKPIWMTEQWGHIQLPEAEIADEQTREP